MIPFTALDSAEWLALTCKLVAEYKKLGYVDQANALQAIADQTFVASIEIFGEEYTEALKIVCDRYEHNSLAEMQGVTLQ
ncbi:hypothetical protein [Sneathiella limimaris]|uniref:hypothetical protein n=1 Tax=Sneathiella limimaris TaxID=1964213 RepID=UPI00146E508E|nr:hypothetical protein [Sneathiella limimaris]